MNATTTREPSATDDVRFAAPTLDTQVRTWLRLEGFAAFVAAVFLYGQLGGDWLWFLPALLAVDISLAGYVRGPRLGAAVYDLAHNWAIGVLVLAAGELLHIPWLMLAGTVLIAHTGMDRAVGYGLKLSTSAHETHLGRMGGGGRGARATSGRAAAAKAGL